VNPVQITTEPTFLEGPVWCPGPTASGQGSSGGSLVVTDVALGALHRVDVDAGTTVKIADTLGGANGSTPCADGGFLVTQNGGLDFESLAMFDSPPPVTRVRSGIQRVSPEGAVTYLTPDAMQAPNDLVIADDGTLYFTDPPAYPLPSDAVGRVMALSRDGVLRVVADGLFYPNGIGIEADGTVVIVENGQQQGRSDFGLVRLRDDGAHERFIARTGDGFCFDVDGRIYLAGGLHGVTVIDPDGTVVEELRLPGEGVTTNCCFGGPDGRTLYATEAVPGGVWAWPGMPTPGRPVVAWPGLLDGTFGDSP
jgi:gluconolactonase